MLTDLELPREKNKYRDWLAGENALKLSPLGHVSFHDKHVISKHLSEGNEPTLVVVLHIHPGTNYHLDRTWLEKAKEKDMSAPQYALHCIAAHWPRSAILSQLRGNQVQRNHPELIDQGFSCYAPVWPCVDGCTYTPKRNDATYLGAQGDILLYRPSPEKPFCITDVAHPDLQQLFRFSVTPSAPKGKESFILMYSTGNFKTAYDIHGMITSD